MQSCCTGTYLALQWIFIVIYYLNVFTRSLREYPPVLKKEVTLLIIIIMKMKYLFLACGMAALFAACQNENEPKAVSDKPGTSGDYRIIIEGEETDAQTSRSSGTIQFVGGTASGAGLYDGVGRAFVSATPDPGYEINYFYGGPDSEPKKYDNANGGATSFDVPINGQDHLFHVGFKKKTGSLTINAGTGGTVSPNGQVAIQREVPFSIKAIPDNGYEFAGWTVNNGSVTIDNANSTSTTATLNSTSGTITAQFKQNKVNVYLSVNTRTESNGSGQIDYITYTITSSVQCSLNVSYYFTETTYRDNAQSEKDQWSQTFGSGDEIIRRINEDDGYGNGKRRTSEITKFVIICEGKTIYNGTSIPEDGTYGNYNIIRK